MPTRRTALAALLLAAAGCGKPDAPNPALKVPDVPPGRSGDGKGGAVKDPRARPK